VDPYGFDTEVEEVEEVERRVAEAPADFEVPAEALEEEPVVIEEPELELEPEPEPEPLPEPAARDATPVEVRIEGILEDATPSIEVETPDAGAPVEPSSSPAEPTWGRRSRRRR